MSVECGGACIWLSYDIHLSILDILTAYQICMKTVYVMDPQINLDGSLFHKHCAKCADCNCQINLSNFNKSETPDQTLLLCKTHYFQRFNEVRKLSSYIINLARLLKKSSCSNIIENLFVLKYLMFDCFICCITDSGLTPLFSKGGGCYLGDEKYKSKQSNRTFTFETNKTPPKDMSVAPRRVAVHTAVA